jgi:Ca-activated chloride channel family protein
MFHSPYWLALLLILPPLAWRMWHGGGDSIEFSSVVGGIELPKTWRQRLAWLPRVCQLAALALAIIALARPREGREQTVIESEGIAIELVVDRSSSMQARDFRINGRRVDRLTAVKQVAGRFIAGDAGRVTARVRASSRGERVIWSGWSRSRVLPMA